jgi:septum formation protein
MRTPSRPIVLATTSAGRRAVFARLGLAHDAVAPSFDESVLPEGLSPSEVARAFALGKARSLEAGPRAIVIGADQVLEHDGAIVRKPTSLEEAAQQLERLSGSTHSLHSAIAVVDREAGTSAVVLVTVRLSMARIARPLLERYVARARPIGSAGGYHYEAEGIALFESVEGGDDSAIVGLPLIPLVAMLRSCGVEPLAAED